MGGTEDIDPTDLLKDGFEIFGSAILKSVSSRRHCPPSDFSRGWKGGMKLTPWSHTASHNVPIGWNALAAHTLENASAGTEYCEYEVVATGISNQLIQSKVKG